MKKLITPLLIISLLALVQGCLQTNKELNNFRADIKDNSLAMKDVAAKFFNEHPEYRNLLEKYGFDKIHNPLIIHKMNTSYLTESEKTIFFKGISAHQQCCKSDVAKKFSKVFPPPYNTQVSNIFYQMDAKIEANQVSLLQDKITVGEYVTQGHALFKELVVPLVEVMQIYTKALKDSHSMAQAEKKLYLNKALKVVAVTLGTVVILAAAYEAQGGTYQQIRQYSGNCQYSWQYAKDGSICGDRAASRRPGGWEPTP